MNVCRGTIHNSQEVTTIQMSTNRKIDKQNVVHLYNTMEHYSFIKRKATLIPAKTQRNLENTLNEKRQTQKGHTLHDSSDMKYPE